MPHADDVNPAGRIFPDGGLIDPAGEFDDYTASQPCIVKRSERLPYLPGPHVIQKNNICSGCCSAEGIARGLDLNFDLFVGRALLRSMYRFSERDEGEVVILDQEPVDSGSCGGPPLPRSGPPSCRVP